MKNTTQVYVLTLNAPSRKTVRLWTGASIHSLRHCSSKKIDRTLAEMQQHVDELQRLSACWRRADRIPSIALDNVPDRCLVGGTSSPRIEYSHHAGRCRR